MQLPVQRYSVICQVSFACHVHVHTPHGGGAAPDDELLPDDPDEPLDSDEVELPEDSLLTDD